MLELTIVSTQSEAPNLGAVENKHLDFLKIILYCRLKEVCLDHHLNYNTPLRSQSRQLPDILSIQICQPDLLSIQITFQIPNYFPNYFQITWFKKYRCLLSLARRVHFKIERLTFEADP